MDWLPFFPLSNQIYFAEKFFILRNIDHELTVPFLFTFLERMNDLKRKQNLEKDNYQVKLRESTTWRHSTLWKRCIATKFVEIIGF